MRRLLSFSLAVLTAWTAGTHYVNADIFRLNINFGFFSFRKNGNCYRTGMYAPLSFCFRNALYTMDTAFITQRTINEFTADTE